MIGAGVVGRHAPLTVALVVAGTGSVLLAVLITAALTVLGLPAAGSAALALAIAATSLAFACIAALAAQIASGARTARGIAAAVCQHHHDRAGREGAQGRLGGTAGCQR